MVLPAFSQRSTRRISAPLRVRVMYLKEHQPVSTPLQDSVRSFLSLLPIPPSARLAVSLPKGRWHGAGTFRVFDNEYLWSTLYRWGCCPCRTTLNTSEPPTYLLVQARQLLWLVKNHDSYEHSLMLTIVSYPNPSPGRSFPERFHLTVSTPYLRTFGALSGRLHTHHGCTMSACFHRIAVTEHWVQQRQMKPPLNSLKYATSCRNHTFLHHLSRAICWNRFSNSIVIIKLFYRSAYFYNLNDIQKDCPKIDAQIWLNVDKLPMVKVDITYQRPWLQ